MHGRWFAVFLSAALSAAACGNVVESGGSAADAGGGDDDDGADGADDGTEPDAGDDGSEADASPEAARGVIRIFSASYVDETGAPIQNAFIDAQFGDFATETCGLELADGDCSVLACTDRTPAAERPDAGAIGVAIDAEEVAVLEPGADGLYPRYERAADDLFDIGIGMTASAKGGEVPAFEATGTAPATLAFDGGVPTSGLGIDVSVGGPYALRWAPGGKDERLRVRITASSDEAERLVLGCSVPASVGDLIVPAGLLALLPLGPHQLETTVETDQRVRAGGHDITLTGAVPALDGPSGNWARGTVNLVP